MTSPSADTISTLEIEAFFTRLDRYQGSHIHGFLRWAKSKELLGALRAGEHERIVGELVESWQNQVEEEQLQSSDTPSPTQAECRQAASEYLREHGTTIMEDMGQVEEEEL